MSILERGAVAGVGCKNTILEVAVNVGDCKITSLLRSASA